MPTGYTAELCEKEVSFERFVMTCARAMGACVMMRDDPLSTPIPDAFEVDDYHTRQAEKMRAELATVEAMSDEQATAEGVREYEALLSSAVKHDEETATVAKRLWDMRSKVNAWKPPTSEHLGLKGFMQEQLESTIKHDGTVSPYYRERAAKAQCVVGPVWKKVRAEKLQKDIAYHEQKQREEDDRAASRNAWIRQLRESLNGH